MKKKLLAFLTTIFVVCVMSISFIACSLNPESPSTDNRDPQIVAVYNTYVAYAEENGVTPLSYEQWLATIKGEKGDQGDGEPNVIETIQVNGTALPVSNKTVNVPVPAVDSTISSSSTNPVQNSAIYNALSDKVNTSALNNYYETSEVDALLGNKADTSDLDDYYTKAQSYNKTELDTMFGGKADATTTQNQISSINSTLETKANTSDVASTYETITNHNNDMATQSARITNNETEIATLQSRMDTFANLDEGSTTGDAELQDIRTDFTGQAYSTAGNSTRGQAKFLNNKIDDLETYFKNHYEEFEILFGSNPKGRCFRKCDKKYKDFYLNYK